jgi:hypothetical protein
MAPPPILATTVHTLDVARAPFVIRDDVTHGRDGSDEPVRLRAEYVDVDEI